MSNSKMLAWFVVGFFVIIGYQNCGGFTAMTDLESGSGAGPGGGSPSAPTDPFLPLGTATFTFDQLESCMDSNGGATGLENCLRINDALPMGLTQAVIDSAVAEVGETPGALAASLAKNNNLFAAGYRYPTGVDVDYCDNLPGQVNMARCLYSRGVLDDSITEEDIDGCLATPGVGPQNLAWCLIVTDKVEDPGFLWASDATDCASFHDANPATMARCLSSRRLIPESVTPAMLSNCMDAIADGQNPNLQLIPRCLRVTGEISSILMGPHTARCSQIVEANGTGSIAGCLDLNGLLPVDGNNVADGTIDQGVIDGCLAARNDNPAEIPFCLRVQGLLPDSTPSIRPDNEHFSFCARVAGENNIAACLGANNLSFGELNQQAIDTCLQNPAINVTNITNCLSTRGILPNFTALVGTAGQPGMVCMGCHNNNNMAGGYSWQNYNGLLNATNGNGDQIIIPGNPAASRAVIRMNDANNPMPPGGLLPQEQRDRVELWIQRGAVENY